MLLNKKEVPAQTGHVELKPYPKKLLLKWYEHIQPWFTAHIVIEDLGL